jgi:hypothetical protein
MDKREFFCLLLAASISIGINANAQSSSSAYQRIELHIQPSIEIASLKGSEVQVSVKQDKFRKTVDNGPEFRIRSNKNFVVKVSTCNEITANDNSGVTKSPNAKNNFQLSVAGKDNDGTFGSYTPISDSPKDIISKGRRGEQTFAINYQVKRSGKVQNENNHPVGVVYTATEP